MINHLSQSENAAKTKGEVFEASFNVREAMSILDISRPTLMKLIREGSVPAFKVGSQWRFKPAELRKIVDGKSNGGHHDPA